jgi:hypothetical protein
MLCGGFSECGPLCRCQNGLWSCETPAACPPFACPTALDELLKLGGQACPTEIGAECQGSSGCFFVDCRCALDPATGEARWSCPATPC